MRAYHITRVHWNHLSYTYVTQFVKNDVMTGNIPEIAKQKAEIQENAIHITSDTKKNIGI